MTNNGDIFLHNSSANQETAAAEKLGQSINHTHARTHTRVQRHDYRVKQTINATRSPSLSSAATSVRWAAAKTRTSRTPELPVRSAATWPPSSPPNPAGERGSRCCVSFWRPDGNSSASSSLQTPPPPAEPGRAQGRSGLCVSVSLSCDPTAGTHVLKHSSGLHVFSYYTVSESCIMGYK